MPTREERLNVRKNEYVAHEAAGKEYFGNFRDNLTLDIEDGLITLEAAEAIQYKMRFVGANLKDGDWKSAYSEIIRVLPDIYCTQSIIDTVTTDIINYISTNYTW